MRAFAGYSQRFQQLTEDEQHHVAATIQRHYRQVCCGWVCVAGEWMGGLDETCRLKTTHFVFRCVVCCVGLLSLSSSWLLVAVVAVVVMVVGGGVFAALLLLLLLSLPRRSTDRQVSSTRLFSNEAGAARNHQQKHCAAHRQ